MEKDLVLIMAMAVPFGALMLIVSLRKLLCNNSHGKSKFLLLLLVCLRQVTDCKGVQWLIMVLYPDELTNPMSGLKLGTLFC